MGTPTHDAMTHLFALTRTLFAPVEDVSVTMAGGDREDFHTSWSSTDVARELDELQYELRQGPCVEAVTSGSVCHVVLQEAARRWPDLLAKVEAYEVGSVLSTPLCPPVGVRGALNVYSPLSEPFGGPAQAAARQLAALASEILVLDARSTPPHMTAVGASRDTIVRAEGVLMAWQGCPPDEAFAMLRRTSARDNRRLHDVAQELLDSVHRADT